MTTPFSSGIMQNLPKTFDHPHHNIPEVVVNEGVRSFDSFSTSLDTKSTLVRAVRNSSVFWSKRGEHDEP